MPLDHNDEPQLFTATMLLLEHGDAPTPYHATVDAIACEFECTLLSLGCSASYAYDASKAATLEISEAVMRADRPVWAFMYDAVENTVTRVVGADRDHINKTLTEWHNSGRAFRPIDVARLREWIAKTYFKLDS